MDNGHAEYPDMQHKLSSLNTPKIFFFKDNNKVPNPNVTVKHLAHIHRDMDHADHAQMATKCIRLGCKMNKSMELRISRVIQECTVCKHEDKVFAHGHGKKYKTDFNTDVLVRGEPVRNDFYYTNLFSLECLHTGYIMARYLNRSKYASRYDMINKMVTKYWVYSEYGDGFGTPRNAFFRFKFPD